MAGRLDRPAGGDLPGSLTLLDLIEEHPSAFAYDWRTRLRLPLAVIGKSMTFGEAWSLVQALATDPSSHVAAALAGWRHPWSQEAIILADLYDLQHQKAAGKKRVKPRPRPWDKKPERRRMVPDPSLTQEEIVAALRAAGHDTL